MVSWHRGTDIRATNHTHLVVCLLSLSQPVHYRKPRGQLQRSGSDERVVKAGRGCGDKEKWRVRISGVSHDAFVR